MIDKIAHVARKHFGHATESDKLFPPRRFLRRSLTLIVAAAALTWLCGLSGSVREVQAGGGGVPGLPACAAGVYNYAYDAAGRLSQVQIGCSYVVTYTYDPVGNLLSVSP
jgi:hypothetical protein